MYIKNLVTHYRDSVDKKISRSRDIVFLEDQTIEDFEKFRRQSLSLEIMLTWV